MINGLRYIDVDFIREAVVKRIRLGNDNFLNYPSPTAL